MFSLKNVDILVYCKLIVFICPIYSNPPDNLPHQTATIAFHADFYEVSMMHVTLMILDSCKTQTIWHVITEYCMPVVWVRVVVVVNYIMLLPGKSMEVLCLYPPMRHWEVLQQLVVYVYHGMFIFLRGGSFVLSGRIRIREACFFVVIKLNCLFIPSK